MRLIIDIPEETYNHVCDIYNRLPTPAEEIQIENAVRSATSFDSVIKDIKAKIVKRRDWYGRYHNEYEIAKYTAFDDCISIIDKHINGKETE